MASAFASAGGSKEGHLDIPQLRLAMVMVLGRAVRENEAEFHLRALREKKAPRQGHKKQTEEQLDANKVKRCRPETTTVEYKFSLTFRKGK